MRFDTITSSLLAGQAAAFAIPSWTGKAQHESVRRDPMSAIGAENSTIIARQGTESDWQWDGTAEITGPSKSDVIEWVLEYDSDSSGTEDLLEWIREDVVTKTPGTSLSVYYVGGFSADAQKLKNERNKDTIETVFYPYDVGPFNKNNEPRKTLMEEEKDHPLAVHNWWRATSRVFAEVSSGIAIVLSDSADLASEKGRNGYASITVSDEMPALTQNDKIDAVYQMHPTLAVSYLASDKLPDALTIQDEPGIAPPANMLQDGNMVVKKLWEKGEAPWEFIKLEG